MFESLSNLCFSSASYSTSFFFSAMERAFFFFFGASIRRGTLLITIEIVNVPISALVNWLATVIWNSLAS